MRGSGHRALHSSPTCISDLALEAHPSLGSGDGGLRDALQAVYFGGGGAVCGEVTPVGRASHPSLPAGPLPTAAPKALVPVVGRASPQAGRALRVAVPPFGRLRPFLKVTAAVLPSSRVPASRPEPRTKKPFASHKAFHRAAV